jgi:autotransporter-associated beta strand protein
MMRFTFCEQFALEVATQLYECRDVVRFRLSILCVGVSLFACGQAFAQATSIWTGSYSPNFYESTPGYNPLNWLDGAVPLYNGTDVVGFTAGVTVNSTLDINSGAPGTNLLGIDVEASVYFGEHAIITDQSFGLGSSGIVVNGNSGLPSSLLISAPVVLNAAQTWSVSYGQLEVDGPISMSVEAPLTLAGAPGTGATFILTSSGSTISDGVSVTGAGTVLSLGASSVGPSTDLDSGPVGTGTLFMGSGTTLATPGGLGQITIGNAIEVASGVLLSPGTCSSFLLSGSISDLCVPGTIEVTGGTVILTGTNTYSGGTTIDSGATLQIGNGGTCGSITGNVIDNNTLAFDLSNCTTFCGSICGTGGITVEDGTVTLMGDNSYSGYTLVNSATLKDGAAGTLSPNSAVWLENGASLSVGNDETINGLKGDCSTTVCISSGSTLLTDGSNGSCNYTYAGTIMGSGALEIGSGGYQILTGSNSYSGGTTIDCMATLQLGNGGTTGSISGDVVDNGTLAFDLSSCSTFCGAICGTGGLLVVSGAVTLIGVNSYSGGTTINCMATLQLGNGGTTGSILAGVVDNGTLAFDLSNCTTFCGPICGTGGVTVEDGTVTLMGTNTYSGTTRVTNATLKDGASGSFSPNSAVSLADGATLGVGYNETINGLSGDCSTTVCISSGSILLTDGYNGSCLYTYSGTIAGCGGLEVGSGGFQILTGSNTYSGGTTIDCMATLQLGSGGTTGSIAGGVVDNGTLAFDLSNCSSFSAGITGMGGVIVENGTVTLSGTNTYSGTTSVNAATLKDGAADSFSPTSKVSLSGASLGVGFDETIGGLGGDCSSTVCITCGSTLVVSGGGPEFAGTIMGGGALEIGAGVLQILSGSNTYGGGTTIESGATLQVGDGDASGSIAGNVVDNGNLAFSNSGCTTFSGSICGSGDVYVEAGTVTFTGTNTYGGTTYVTSASLKDGAADSFSQYSPMVLTNGASVGVNYNEVINGLSGDCSNTVCIASGSTLLTDGFNSCTSFAGSIMGSGDLAIGSGAYLILSGSNTFTGATTIDCGGTLQLGYGGSTGSISGDVLDNGTLAFDLASCTSFCGTISGNGNVFVGQGTVTLMGDNTYSGGTSLADGTTLYVTNSGSLGTGALSTDSTVCDPTVLAASGSCVTLTNNIVVGGSGLTLNFSGSPKLTLSGTISDAGSYDALVINGPVDLEGANTYSGGTTINDACVTIGTSTGLGTGALTAMGSTLTFTSNSSPTLYCPTIEDDTVATFNGTSAVLTNLSLAESTLNFNGSCATLDDMVSDSSCSGNTINISGETQLTINVSCNNETDYHGVITDDGTGTGTLVVTGTGLLDLKGANSYGGGTTVNGGLLVASNCSALGTGPVTVNGSAGLGVDTNVSIANQVTLNGGSLGGFGTFNPASADCIAVQGGSLVVGGSGSLSAVGGSPGQVIGTLSFGSNATLVLGGGGAMQFSIMNATGSPGTDYSQIAVAGTANVTASNVDPFTIQLVGVDSTGLVIGTANTFNPAQAYTWTLLSAGMITNFSPSAFVVDSSTYFSNPTNSGTFAVSVVGNDLTLNFTPVPEPSTWALMASGICAAFGAAVRRRRRS